MGTFFVYILKTSVCLTAFYLFYRLLLSKETFHRFNRIALLGILVLSLLIPFCEITIQDKTEVQQTIITLEHLLMQVDMPMQEIQSVAPATPLWIPVILIIYLLGIIFFSGRQIYSLIHMIHLLRHGKKEKIEKRTTLVLHNKEIAPFSWMNYVVISEKDLKENGKEIIAHELAHIRNRHSIDLLIADICIFFQWFNPASWLLKQELQNIHEYEADETVIRQGINAKEYQLLLIRKAVGTRLYSMANSFNHSKLKKRITMMLKEKSNPWARVKYLYVLPLAVLTLTAFARPEISNEFNEISAIKVNDFTSILETKHTNIPLAKKDTVYYTGKKIKTKIIQNEKDTLHATETVMVDSMLKITYFICADSIPVFHLTLSDTNGVHINKGDSSGYTSKVFLKNGEVRVISATTSITSDHSQPELYIINGKIIPKDIALAIDSKRIKTISILKDDSVTARYGIEGKNGVVEISLLSDDEYHDNVTISRTIATSGNQIFWADSTAEGYVVVNKSGEPSRFNVKVSEAKILSQDETASQRDSMYIKSISSDKKNNTILVKGSVKDEYGKPLAGANIYTSNIQTLTDKNGKFTLEVPKGTKLNVTCQGMKRIKIKALPSITVCMEKE